jgi:hypothetical protein
MDQGRTIMAGLIRKILRAAVAQPWEYVGDGAPDDWEFRISPDEETLAVYNPSRGKWYLFHDVIVLAEVKSLDEMDRNTTDWRQFLSVEDPE